MFSWGAKRKTLYFVMLAFFVVFGVVIFSGLFFREKPNCFDGKNNQDELGVDCGGSCTAICPSSGAQLSIDWARFFKVKDGVFSAAVRVQNPNSALEAFQTPYKIKFYSGDLFLAEREGVTYVPPGQAFGIFEGGVNLGNKTPTRITFEWLEWPTWVKFKGTPKTVFIKEVVRDFDNELLPRLEVTLENGSLLPARNVVGFAVVYGADGNAVASSKTVLDVLVGGGRDQMVFSWPERFGGSPGRVEILHWILPAEPRSL